MEFTYTKDDIKNMILASSEKFDLSTQEELDSMVDKILNNTQVMKTLETNMYATVANAIRSAINDY